MHLREVMTSLPAVSGYFQARVLRVHHWNDTLFSFVTERDSGFRFVSGQFTMVGLADGARPLARAYSMVSSCHEEHLEFLSIKVPDGQLTARLQHLQPGDHVYVGRKATGTLVMRQLLPGRRLFLLSTGTGLAPFLSLVKDPEPYEHFERIILTHTCRRVSDLAYRSYLTEELPQDEFLGPLAKSQLTYYATVTREPFPATGRITERIRSGALFEDLGIEGFDPAQDRFMLCGSPGMLTDVRALLEERGFTAGSAGEPGHYVWEKAFAES